MRPIVLFRTGTDKDLVHEREICSKYFETTDSRCLCRDSFVIGRYSVLPYYKEVEQDLRHNGSMLVNSLRQHNWIAQFEYYDQFEGLTPRTWFDDLRFTDHQGPFIVKGRTNSRKYNWKTQFYAETREEVSRVSGILRDDYEIGTQGLVIREFVPLKVLETGPCGTPYTNEWRIFCYQDTILSFGYYWSCAEEKTIKKAKLSKSGLDFAHKCVNIAYPFTNFYVLDIAEKEDGEWILIEMNDGQMSGLSENNSEALYSNLASVLQ